MSIIGENIRTIRKRLGFTQNLMAEKLGIKRSLLGAYEEGRATPKLDVLNVYSDMSGVEIAELVNQLAKQEAAVEAKPLRGRPRKGHASESASTPKKQEPVSYSYRNGSAETASPAPSAWHDGSAYFSGQDIRQEIRTVAVTQAEKGGDSFEAISNASLKEYLAQRANASFLAKQPRMSLPFLNAGEIYRAFGEGNRVQDGRPAARYLVGLYVRNWLTLSANESYLIVTAKDLLHARLENRLGQNETLLITSGRNLADGKVVSNLVIAGALVLEIWKLDYVVAHVAQGLQNEPELSNRLSRIESYLGL